MAPEVVETEIAGLLVGEGRKAVQQIRDQLRILQAIAGSHPAISLPNDDSLRESVAARLRELEELILPAPIRDEDTRRALLRVNEKRSPNRKREQFKDSLIWEAVRGLAREYEVYFVTDDGAFYSDDGKNMAEDLSEECAREGFTVSLHRAVRQLLPALQGTAPQLDYSAIARDLFEHLNSYLSETAARDGFTVGSLEDHKIRAFATEDHSRLVLTYELSGGLLSDGTGERVGERRGAFEVAGEGSFDLNAQRVMEARPGRCSMSLLDEAGQEKRSQNIVLGTATAYLGGEPPKRLEIREPLDTDT